MLGKRLEAVEKSQTLPRFDGQDEGETLESQFDIISIANSCPDLTIIESLDKEDLDKTALTVSPINTGSDVVDGLFFKHTIPIKLPLSFRRSTSLNSLAGDDFKEIQNAVDGNTVGAIQPGNVSKVVGKLEAIMKKPVITDQEILPSYLLSSQNGPRTLHKSTSSPSVPQIFGPSPHFIADLQPKITSQSIQRGPSNQLSFNQQQSSKRSFFRRKHKTKSSSVNSHPPVVVQHYRNLRVENQHLEYASNDGDSQESTGYIALSNPSLGLQDPDADCWAMFMGKDVVSLLDDKEVKRQEHMYELILTEKHHCLTLALMHHLFVGGMKKAGYSRQAGRLFPGLVELLEVHFTFLQRMRERQLKFRDLEKPMDTLADLIVEQFSGDQWQLMVRLYGLLCSSHKPSLELFKSSQKDPKFAALVNIWSKEPLLARKNVPECLLLVAQRITKYPLLFEPLIKTSTSSEEIVELRKALQTSKNLNEKVNGRVAEREQLLEFCQKMDPKSVVTVGKRRVSKDDVASVPTRRLLFSGQASVINRALIGNGHGGNGGPVSARNLVCNVLILTDSIIFTQDLSGRYHFVSPSYLPGMVMLNHLIIREKAGQNSSLFLVLGTGTAKPEMIEIEVINPSSRDVWVAKIRDAIQRWQEEGDTISDGDEEFLSDSVEYPDMRTTRALEELQDQDSKILALLRSRSKLVEILRADKPHLWIANNFEGKDEVLASVSHASSEVQRMISHMDPNSANGVNRSASCVSEHVTSEVLTGLPRRADTFGGFDSQQRLSIDFSQSTNNKVLLQIVVQLADLCGEMFHQMVPQLTPHTNQNQHQLQRRMEDLREAQQRLETEKADWQRELSMQKAEIERKQNEMKNKANVLQEVEKDIIEQREQLYRKLEALQRQGSQGIRSNLDSTSHGSLGTNTEKIPPVNLPPRRAASQAQVPLIPSHASSTSVKPTSKQQIPHFLANSSSVKSLAVAQSPAEAPKPLPRTGKPGENSGDYLLTNQLSQGKGPRVLSRNGSQPVQQMLPYRLSEGLKTSSLPRGVGSRSVSSMSHISGMDHPPTIPSKLRNSSSASHVLHHSHSAAGSFVGDSANSNNSFIYGPQTSDRMSSYYRNNSSMYPGKKSVGYGDYTIGTANANSSVPIVHRRSGSSPVPMSSVVSSNPTTSSHTQEDDFDMTNVLFL